MTERADSAQGTSPPRRDPLRIHFEVGERPDDLIVCIVLAMILVALAYVAPDNLARQILGVIFVLFLPGYVATAALFPENDQIDGIERLALSLGLSIAIVPLIGLALNFTPFKIALDPILASCSAFIVLVSAIAWYRRSLLPPDERFSVVIDFELDFRGMPLGDKLLTIGVAAMLVASIVVLAWAVTTPREDESFTQLTLLGPGGMATDYPRDMTVGENKTVLVSVESFENDPTDYTLVIVLTNGSELDFTVGQYSIDWIVTNSLSPFVGIAQNFSLDDGDYYNQTFDFAVSAEGSWNLQFLLFVDGQEIGQESYRMANIWLFVGP